MAEPTHTVSKPSTAVPPLLRSPIAEWQQAVAEHTVPPLRRTPIAEWQRALDEHDEHLEPELKQTHPILPMEVIKQQYPDQWLALLITHVDERGNLAAARVFDAAGHDEREALEERGKPLSRTLPERRFFFFYTGTYDDFGSAW